MDKGGPNLVGLNVMHTNFGAMLPTLRIVREVWSGPLGVYPDHGYFKMPAWEFQEVDLAEASALAQSWLDECGISLLGGCCGTGPDLIEAFAEVAAKHNAKLGPAESDADTTASADKAAEEPAKDEEVRAAAVAASEA